jgi:hypothetical protein
MVDNAIAFFYPGESSFEVPPDARHIGDKVLGDYSHQYESVSKPNSWDFDVPIPRADLDAVGESFAVIYNDEEALKLAEDSTMMAGHVIDMLGVDMSLG